MFHDTEMWTKINLPLPFSSKLNIYICETDAWAYLYSYAYQLAKQNRFAVFPLCSVKHQMYEIKARDTNYYRTNLKLAFVSGNLQRDLFYVGTVW